MSYAPTTWEPPPSRRDKFNAEVQHEFALVANGVAEFLERRGELMPAAVVGWKSLGSECYALRFGDGSEWFVRGHECCGAHPFVVDKVERVEA